MKFKILRFKRLRSTNDTAIRIIQNSSLKYGMIIAENQSHGRGQYGKKWLCFKGNLFVSFFYSLENLNLTLSQITKLNCMLVKKIIFRYYKKRITYKKPNDLLINGKKISGILQEIIFLNKKKFLITGIGINIIKNPYIKNYPATNLQEVTKKSISKSNVENKLKQLFEKSLSKLYKNK